MLILYQNKDNFVCYAFEPISNCLEAFKLRLILVLHFDLCTYVPAGTLFDSPEVCKTQICYTMSSLTMYGKGTTRTMQIMQNYLDKNISWQHNWQHKAGHK